MTVGKDYSPYTVFVLNEIGEVGYDHINTVHIFIGKSETAVDYEDIFSVFVDSQVLTDLI